MFPQQQVYQSDADTYLLTQWRNFSFVIMTRLNRSEERIGVNAGVNFDTPPMRLK